MTSFKNLVLLLLLGALTFTMSVSAAALRHGPWVDCHGADCFLMPGPAVSLPAVTATASSGIKEPIFTILPVSELGDHVDLHFGQPASSSSSVSAEPVFSILPISNKGDNVDLHLDDNLPKPSVVTAERRAFSTSSHLPEPTFSILPISDDGEHVVLYPSSRPTGEPIYSILPVPNHGENIELYPSAAAQRTPPVASDLFSKRATMKSAPPTGPTIGMPGFSQGMIPKAPLPLPPIGDPADPVVPSFPGSPFVPPIAPVAPGSFPYPLFHPPPPSFPVQPPFLGMPSPPHAPMPFSPPSKRSTAESTESTTIGGELEDATTEDLVSSHRRLPPWALPNGARLPNTITLAPPALVPHTKWPRNEPVTGKEQQAPTVPLRDEMPPIWPHHPHPWVCPQCYGNQGLEHEHEHEHENEHEHPSFPTNDFPIFTKIEQPQVMTDHHSNDTPTTMKTVVVVTSLGRRQVEWPTGVTQIRGIPVAVPTTAVIVGPEHGAPTINRPTVTEIATPTSTQTQWVITGDCKSAVVRCETMRA